MQERYCARMRMYARVPSFGKNRCTQVRSQETHAKYPLLFYDHE